MSTYQPRLTSTVPPGFQSINAAPPAYADVVSATPPPKYEDAVLSAASALEKTSHSHALPV